MNPLGGELIIVQNFKRPFRIAFRQLVNFFAINFAREIIRGVRGKSPVNHDDRVSIERENERQPFDFCTLTLLPFRQNNTPLDSIFFFAKRNWNVGSLAKR